MFQPRRVPQVTRPMKSDHTTGLHAFVLTYLKTRNDVGMIEGSGGLRFLLKAAKTLGVSGPIGGENLNCNIALQHGIACAMDLAHATCAQRRQNLISVQPSARFERHSALDYTRVAFTQADFSRRRIQRPTLRKPLLHIYPRTVVVVSPSRK